MASALDTQGFASRRADNLLSDQPSLNHSWTKQVMRAVIFLALSLVSGFASGSDGIEVFTTTTTNASGSILTRDGQTNLVRTTQTRAGTLAIRVHQLYQRGNRVAFLTGLPDSGSLTSEAGSPFSLSLEYGASNVLRFVAIADKSGTVCDAFRCTNGVLFPVGSSELSDAAEVGAGAKELINSRKVSPEQFHRKLEEIIKKAGDS